MSAKHGKDPLTDPLDEPVDDRRTGPGTDSVTDPDAGRTMALSEERLRVDTEQVESGRVQARKRVDTERVEHRVPRGVEHADIEQGPVLEGDSGEVLTLEDGSLSIPVFEEQIVVTKRLVVRERVVVRKHTVYEEHRVTADLRREELEVQTSGDVGIVDEAAGRR